VIISEELLKATKLSILEDISHPYLKEQLKVPEIDDSILQMVLSLILSKNIPWDQAIIYAKAVMLIQIALDTHDLVPKEDQFCERKNSQLQVLAGDYYSGLYYRNLAMVPNIRLIQFLAEGIHIVNEHKMSVYKNEVSTATDFMEAMKKVETGVYQKLAEFFQDEEWKSLITNWIHLYHLSNKKDNYEQYIRENQLDLYFPTGIESVDQWLDQYIEKLKEAVMADQRKLLGSDEPFPLGDMGIQNNRQYLALFES